MRAGRLLSYATSQLFVLGRDARAARRSARTRALLAGAAALAGAVMLAALHLAPASRGLDPMSAPLSQYAFAPDGWLFDVAVSALALGLALLGSALVRARCVATRSPARALFATCSLSLVLVVVFPEHDANGAVGTAGLIHWMASTLAFGGLTIAPAVLGRHRASRCSRLTALTRRLSVATGPCFLLALTASLVRYETPLPVPAWSFPLAERGLVALELAIAGVLTAWAWRGCACSEHLVLCASESSGPTEHSVRPRDEHAVAPSLGQLPTLAAGDDDEGEAATRLIA